MIETYDFCRGGYAWPWAKILWDFDRAKMSKYIDCTHILILRILALYSLFLLLASQRSQSVVTAVDGGLYPPGLLPLVSKANLLLSSGQFHEAARVY